MDNKYEKMKYGMRKSKCGGKKKPRLTRIKKRYQEVTAMLKHKLK